VLAAFARRRSGKQLCKLLGGHVSSEVLSAVLSNPGCLQSSERDVTVMMSDMMNFNCLPERLSPDELVSLLNTYTSTMIRIILEFNGTIDRYIGGAISCFWGAPISQPDHASLACRCALQQLREIESIDLHSKYGIDNKPSMGLSSGKVFWGGSTTAKPMDFRLVGNVVSIAEALERLNREYKTEALISGPTFQHVKTEFVLREVDSVRLAEGTQVTTIFELAKGSSRNG
jgi:adenylate cyclase